MGMYRIYYVNNHMYCSNIGKKKKTMKKKIEMKDEKG